jgi:hypothetical protein
MVEGGTVGGEVGEGGVMGGGTIGEGAEGRKEEEGGGGREW